MVVVFNLEDKQRSRIFNQYMPSGGSFNEFYSAYGKHVNNKTADYKGVNTAIK